MARIVCERIANKFGQPMIVKSRAGAGGSIGSADVARAIPDGCELGLVTVSTTPSNAAMNPKVAYDPIATRPWTGSRRSVDAPLEFMRQPAAPVARSRLPPANRLLTVERQLCGTESCDL